MTDHYRYLVAQWRRGRDDMGACSECGTDLEPGGCCHNPDCGIGARNNYEDYCDYAYHAAADREAERMGR